MVRWLDQFKFKFKYTFNYDLIVNLYFFVEMFQKLFIKTN